MVAIVVTGVSYMLVDRLGSTNQSVVTDRERNARVLNQAKQALIGYVAQQAATAGENNPGRLPCPEAGAYYGDPAQEGIAAPNCTLPAVGRLPWRTLGLDKLVDANTEPLWYVVSAGWALTNATVPPLQTLINSDSAGQLTVDGVANNAIALIIAPGAAMSAQAGAGCTAWAQSRPTAGAPDLRNYLECDNATSPANATFATSAPGQTFNDQVLRVAAVDLIPSLEAAIAHRTVREIVPALQTVYARPQWTNIPVGNHLFPFAAPFVNPAMSNYRGVDGIYQGLLPLTYSETSSGSGVPCTADPRCDPLFVAWTGGTLSGPSINSPSCTVVTGTTTRLDCTFHYTCSLLFCTPPTLNYTIKAQAARVGMSLRQINMSAPIGSANVTATLGNASGVFSNNGSASLTLTGTMSPTGSGGFLSALLGNTLCGLPLISVLLGCKSSLISVPIGVLADHPVLDAGNATYGWFVRNEWHQLTYYAAAGPNTADGIGAFGCTTTFDCLRFENPGMTEDKRAVLVLAGRSINGSARPSATLTDYLEFGNGDAGTRYEQNPVSRVVGLPKAPFNDRVMIVDSN